LIESLKSNRGIFISDNMILWGRSLGFLRNKSFMDAFSRNAKTQQERGIIWRTQTLVWAANRALRLPEGDFVECGCYKGTTAKIIVESTGFRNSNRTFFLYDMFEYKEGLGHHSMPEHGPDLYKRVQERFSEIHSVKVIQGRIPEVFLDISPSKISLLHIDLNNVESEIASLEHLFSKVVPGGIIILDDYGWLAYLKQKTAEDDWFKKNGHEVLELPTGQGMVIV
jgi:O-methyltransferase